MIEFYSVKKKTKVSIEKDKVSAVKYESLAKNGKTRIRYALKAVDSDGTKLTKFCSEEVYNQFN